MKIPERSGIIVEIMNASVERCVEVSAYLFSSSNKVGGQFISRWWALYLDANRVSRKLDNEPSDALITAEELYDCVGIEAFVTKG